MSDPLGDSVLVTGALGQIGTDLVDALREKHGKSSVIASDIRDDQGHPSANEGPFVVLDVLDTDSITRICKDEGIGTVYHLAALLSATGEKNPDLCRKIGSAGRQRVIEKWSWRESAITTAEHCRTLLSSWKTK